MALKYPEPEVFRFLPVSIMLDEEGDVQNPPFSEEHPGVAFLNLKIVLDAFLEARE